MRSYQERATFLRFFGWALGEGEGKIISLKNYGSHGFWDWISGIVLPESGKVCEILDAACGLLVSDELLFTNHLDFNFPGEAQFDKLVNVLVKLHLHLDRTMRHVLGSLGKFPGQLADLDELADCLPFREVS